LPIIQIRTASRPKPGLRSFLHIKIVETGTHSKLSGKQYIVQYSDFHYSDDHHSTHLQINTKSILACLSLIYFHQTNCIKFFSGFTFVWVAIQLGSKDINYSDELSPGKSYSGEGLGSLKTALETITKTA
jgi:predicted MPP superfamily phosphohydrolase